MDVPMSDLEAHHGGVGGKAFVSTNTSHRSDAGKSWIDGDGDSGSEKDILPGPKAANGGIIRTTAFTVKTDSVRG